MSKAILVSACLLGLNTRYSGETRDYPEVETYLLGRNLIPVPVCPEQLGGLSTPRPAAAFTRGDGNAVLDGTGCLKDAKGENLVDPFLRGAEQALRIARLAGCDEALLKERSPSCGCRTVYRENELVQGQGVTAALLARHGITLLSEKDI